MFQSYVWSDIQNNGNFSLLFNAKMSQRDIKYRGTHAYGPIQELRIVFEW